MQSDQGLGEATGEVLLMLGGNQLTQFKEIGKCRTVMHFAGDVDGGAPFTGHHLAFSVLGESIFLAAPLAGGVEVFEAEADRIDLAMAAGALGFLHVGGEFLSLGEGLVVEARELPERKEAPRLDGEEH